MRLTGEGGVGRVVTKSEGSCLVLYRFCGRCHVSYTFVNRVRVGISQNRMCQPGVVWKRLSGKTFGVCF